MIPANLRILRQWVTTITLNYKLGGESKQKELVVPGNPTPMYCLMETESESVSGSVDNMNVGYELQLVYKAADPHTYIRITAGL